MTWQEALTDYYQHYEKLDDTNRAWLQKKVLLDAPLLSDTALGTDDLLALVTRNNTVNHTLLVYTLVWQSMGLILVGKEDPIEGNVRSFWYTFANPVYGHHRLYKTLHRDPAFQAYITELETTDRYRRSRAKLAASAKIGETYCKKLCEDAIQQFVIQKVFRYQGPFQFIDHKNKFRLLGEKRASLVFFVEKEGLFHKYCDRYNTRYGISALASQGFPSHLTLEFFGDQLSSKGITRVGLVGLVDYDPAGFLIAEEYRHKFEQLGFGVKSFTILTNVGLFTEEALENEFDDLEHVHPSREKITQAWFEKTGGIHGKRRGIHVNLARMGRVDVAMKQWYNDQVRMLEDEDG